MQRLAVFANPRAEICLRNLDTVTVRNLESVTLDTPNKFSIGIVGNDVLPNQFVAFCKITYLEQNDGKVVELNEFFHALWKFNL